MSEKERKKSKRHSYLFIYLFFVIVIVAIPSSRNRNLEPNCGPLNRPMLQRTTPIMLANFLLQGIMASLVWVWAIKNEKFSKEIFRKRGKKIFLFDFLFHFSVSRDWEQFALQD